MSPEQYKAIRRRFFKDDPGAFLAEMGYAGSPTTLRTRARRYENGKLEIPPHVARFAWLLDQWRLQEAKIDPFPGNLDGLPEWPEGM
jgi:hypothetical protein